HARSRGLTVNADAYPYTAGATYLSQLLPSWAGAGGTEALLSRLSSPDERARIKAGMQAGRNAPISGVSFDDIAYGACVRVLGHYERETPLFSLPEAVRRMTGLPADILGLRDRGYVREGLAADLVVFDPSRVTDRSTYAQPTLRPAGIEYVVVNGAVAV